MSRQKDIQKRAKWIDRLFIGLVITLFIVILVNGYSDSIKNISFFEQQILDQEKQLIKSEVDSRIDEISNVQEEIDVEFRKTLQERVEFINLFATKSLESLDEAATLEEKRDRFVDTLYEYNQNTDEYLSFSVDMDGYSYLSGLMKNMEGTNILYKEDTVTGTYIFQDMIEMVQNSETQSGFISYYWIKEVGGEDILKTSYVYWNQEVDMMIGIGAYNIDYINAVQEELFSRIGSYDDTKGRYYYVISYSGDIIYHPDEDFSKNDFLGLKTTEGNSFHDSIMQNLTEEPYTYLEYYYEHNGETEEKIAYISNIDEWDMYIGRSIVFEDLEIEVSNYIYSILPMFIVSNVIFLGILIGISIILKRLIKKNLIDVEEEFEEKNISIKKASYTDSLTKLYNRSYFDASLEEIIKYESSIIAIMIDSNGLKLVNDAYGHQTGDELLEKLSNLISEVFNDGHLFRWGGDEFVIILNDVTLEEMKIREERFNNSMENIKIKRIPLSAALGYCYFEEKNLDIFKLLNEAEKKMYEKKTHQSSSNKRVIIDNILSILCGSYNFEQKHSENVMKYSVLIGESMGLDKGEVDRLRLAALLHDIGKIGIADNIINKKEKLSENDIYEIKQHPEKGFRILAAYPELSEYGKIVLHHHEFYDGTGYPRQLSGTDIPLFSRIISIADSYDVMREERVYKKSMSKEMAIKELKKCSGSQFDPELVEVFISSVKNIIE